MQDDKWKAWSELLTRIEMSKLKLEYDWLLSYVRIIKQMTHNINTSTTNITKYSFQRRDEDYFNFP